MRERVEFNKSCNLIGSGSGRNFLIRPAHGGRNPRAFTNCQQKPKISVGNSNGTAHSTGKFPKKMEILRRIPLFPFQPRNDRKNPVPFVNSHSTRFTSASFPAFRHCRCSGHFDLSLFFSSRGRLGPGETPHRENPVALRASIPAGFSVQMVNAPSLGCVSLCDNLKFSFF